MKTIQNSFKKKPGEKEKQPINTFNGLAGEENIKKEFRMCLDRRWLLWCYV